MEQKQFWTTVVVALVVAVIVSVVTANLVSENAVAFAPNAPAMINAHSCSADGVCEVVTIVGVHPNGTWTKLGVLNGMNVSGMIESNSISVSSASANTVSSNIVSGAWGSITKVGNDLKIKTLAGQPNKILLDAGGFTDDLIIDSLGNITIPGFAGANNRPVCVNLQGMLYRGNSTGCSG